MQGKTGISFPLVEADAGATGLPDASFDLSISEYGAAIWADPYRWIPEAGRLLRPGGRLIFLGNGTIFMLCAPDEEDEPAGTQLLRPYFGMHRFEWTDDDPGIEFHLGHGDLVRLLRRTGFEIIDLVELFAPAGGTDHDYYDYIPTEWAQQWPPEEIWRVRKQRP